MRPTKHMCSCSGFLTAHQIFRPYLLLPFFLVLGSWILVPVRHKDFRRTLALCKLLSCAMVMNAMLPVRTGNHAIACRSRNTTRWNVLRRDLPGRSYRRKHTVVYAMGEGWTGALGTGRLDQFVPGHLDDDLQDQQSLQPPVVLFDSAAKTSQNPLQQQKLLSCAVGWGHTALLVESKTTHSIQNESCNGNQQQPSSALIASSPESFTTSAQLMLTGRPHEFASLLRLKRMSPWVRQWMTYLTYRTILRSKLAEEMKEANDPNKDVIPLNPVDIVGRTLTYLTKYFGNPKTEPNWSVARDQSFLVEPTNVPLPFNTSSSSTETMSTAVQVQPNLDEIDPKEPIPNDVPVHVSCSAGITAITTAMGCVYTFGLNGIGQCGVGNPSNNVWQPSRVTGLSREFCGRGYRATVLPQSYPIQQTALGLQRTYSCEELLLLFLFSHFPFLFSWHDPLIDGLCLNIEGEMFAWGKGDRGQIGNDTVETECHTGMPITKAIFMNHDYTEKIEYYSLGKISQISAGLIHSAAFEEENNFVYTWGKHVLPFQVDEAVMSQRHSFWPFRLFPVKRIASDARVPVRMLGLPSNRKVLRIACGSHHTAVLLEDGSVWAVGITTDTKRPLHEAKCIVEAGIIDLASLTQFTAHMDRTTVVFGGQVLQVHLWDDPELQSRGFFTPDWVDQLLLHDPSTKIREVHRSWLHSAIVAEIS